MCNRDFQLFLLQTYSLRLHTLSFISVLYFLLVCFIRLLTCVCIRWILKRRMRTSCSLLGSGTNTKDSNLKMNFEIIWILKQFVPGAEGLLLLFFGVFRSFII